jgi:hypothetical protein
MLLVFLDIFMNNSDSGCYRGDRGQKWLRMMGLKERFEVCRSGWQLMADLPFI